MKCICFCFLIICSLVFLIPETLMAQPVKSADSVPLYRNTGLAFEIRAKDLVSRMTLEEKIAQMGYAAPAIARLGIPEYNWWNECLHGVARNGIATVFPQAIGMAATWDVNLIRQEADVISTEARAKYNDAILKGQHGIYQGLTFWSPNINIFRDPRWGRGQETYGEDPFLTAQIGKAFVEGLQGNHPGYLKVIATAKHFAVHSGPERDRHRFDAWPSQRDLFETYLPAFEALVKEAGVYSIMSCYNRIYGTPASANSYLLENLLREKWGFKGYVVSDCWAISDIYNFHNFVPTEEKAASLAVNTGIDLSCGPEYGSLQKAVQLGYTSLHEIDEAVGRLMLARFRLGLFDPPEMVPYSRILPSRNDTPENRALALQVARESIVLLKNQNQLLPLTDFIRRIAVIGPYAKDTAVLLGNYNGIPSSPVTILQGIVNQQVKNRKILFAPGVEKPEVLAKRLQGKSDVMPDSMEVQLEQEAMNIAGKVDVIIFCGGISPNLEGEEMDVSVEGFSGGDRTQLGLPKNQLRLLKKLKATGKPVILVLTNGSALDLSWAKDTVDAIVESWYPGEEGGNAIADVIFGKFNPAGRLPVTFYKSVSDLPAFDDYSMEGRTYRYFRSEPVYPFGYGLSYTNFEYSGLKISKSTATAQDTVSVQVAIRNTGKYAGEEVVQLYIRQPESVMDLSIKTLKAFYRIQVPKGETTQVDLRLPVPQLRHFETTTGDYAIAKGLYEVQIGSSSSDIHLTQWLEVE